MTKIVSMKNFKWYRRYLGGTWYQSIMVPIVSQILCGPTWSREIPKEIPGMHRIRLLKTESY